MTGLQAVSAIPARGTLGDLSAQTLLTALTTQQASGTLYLSRAGTGALLTLQSGEPHARIDFGGADGAPPDLPFDLSATGATFGFWSAATDADLATLPSRYPGAPGPLWALPALSEQALLSTAETELRGLTARLTADVFSGALVLEAPPSQNADASTHGTCGLLLFQAGRLGGAVCEAAGQVQSGGAALRTLSQLRASLTIYALPEPVAAGLLGLLLGLQISGDVGGSGRIPEGFSGLELTSAAARYYRAGHVYLQLPRPLQGLAEPVGLFASCQRVPSLTLPGEPRGWEGRRYGLTLRGRDALNPMTELAMRFRSDFGRSGRRTLEGFRHDHSAEMVAEALGLEMDDLTKDELKKTVERLEQEGFIRTVSDDVSDAVSDSSPTPHLQPR